MEFVNYQQCPVPLEFREVEIRRPLATADSVVT